MRKDDDSDHGKSDEIESASNESSGADSQGDDDDHDVAADDWEKTYADDSNDDDMTRELKAEKRKSGDLEERRFRRARGDAKAKLKAKRKSKRLKNKQKKQNRSERKVKIYNTKDNQQPIPENVDDLILPTHDCRRHCLKDWTKEEVMSVRKEWWDCNNKERDDLKRKLVEEKSTNPYWMVRPNRSTCVKCTCWLLCVSR